MMSLNDNYKDMISWYPTQLYFERFKMIMAFGRLQTIDMDIKSALSRYCSFGFNAIMRVVFYRVSTDPGNPGYPGKTLEFQRILEFCWLGFVDTLSVLVHLSPYSSRGQCYWVWTYWEVMTHLWDYRWTCCIQVNYNEVVFTVIVFVHTEAWSKFHDVFLYPNEATLIR